MKFVLRSSRGLIKLITIEKNYYKQKLILKNYYIKIKNKFYSFNK